MKKTVKRIFVSLLKGKSCSYPLTYKGCYIDLGDGAGNTRRDLEISAMLGVFWGIGLGTNTVETCVSFCDSKGYRIAGLQIGYDINNFVSFF